MNIYQMHFPTPDYKPSPQQTTTFH